MSLRLDWPRPPEILQYYHRTKETYEWFDPALPTLQAESSQFYLKSEDEIAVIIQQMAAELDQQCVLMMTASIEATFQVDLQMRRVLKKQDHVSSALRRHEKRMMKLGRRIEIEDILEIWKDHIGHVNAFGDLKQVISYRHWLAHGRYWVQKSGLRDLNLFGTWRRWEAICDRIQRTHDFPLVGA